MIINDKAKDKLEIIKQAEKEIKKKHIGKINPKRGHSLFEVDLELKSIQLAKFDRQDVIMFEVGKENYFENKKVTIRKNCKYISALNRKNVIKILKRDFDIVL